MRELIGENFTDGSASNKKPSIAESVHQEIEAAKKQNPENWQLAFFNNFQCNFPNGHRRRIIAEGIRKPDDPYMDSGRTFQEFFDDIDRTIDDLKIDPGELNRDVQDQKYELVTELMIRLLEMGYKKSHLWS